MRDEQTTFRHESLLDAAAVQDILKAIGRGLSKGRLAFSDDDGEVVLVPPRLVDLKVTATRDSSRQRVNIRLSWRVEETPSPSGGGLRVG